MRSFARTRVLLVCGCLALAAAGCRPLDLPEDLAHTDQIGALRLIAPLSGATVTSHRPTLRWQGELGAARLELCADRACTRSRGSVTVDASGTRARPDEALPIGVTFWRLRAADGTTTPTWQFHVGARDAPVDSSYGSRLDLDGDGYDDVVVCGGAEGSMDAPAAVTNVFFGGPDDSAAVRGVELPVDCKGFIGTASGNLGDLDGDGFVDFGIWEFPDPDDGGKMRVYFGGPAGPTPDHTRELALPPQQLFGTVSRAGDINGDGYADLFVQSAVFDGPMFAYVALGGPDGPSLNGPMTMVADLSADEAFEFTGPVACDFDGDGYGDLLFGANDGSGLAYVEFGAPGELDRQAILHSPDTSWTQFGHGLAAADVDGDGYCDALVSDVHTGVFYVFPGGAAGMGAPTARSWTYPGGAVGIDNAGDVDGDGREDLVIGAWGFGAYLQLSNGAPQIAVARPTQFAVFAGAGDVDADGHDDVIVGAIGTSAGVDEDANGVAYIYRGAGTGVGAMIPLSPTEPLLAQFGVRVIGLR